MLYMIFRGVIINNVNNNNIKSREAFGMFFYVVCNEICKIENNYVLMEEYLIHVEETM